MEKLIPLINKLQEIEARSKFKFNLNLPQIVVIGGQSSGKSSVLESIVGIDFLPRGTNIVTRRPIIIQLIYTSYTDKPWAEFPANRPGERFYDFAKVREEIDVDTERVCGKNKNISDKPLLVKVFSSTVVDLTLVDLPGMTKIPTGDQPFDIESKINDLVLKYVQPRTAIIMAVCAANVDLANSDALKMARRVDPMGERTLGVVTKIDLMDEGTNAIELLTGKIYPLKLGYIGVVCRSQKDILQQKSITQALESEDRFFRANSYYYPIRNRLGIPYLSSQLNKIIVKHIKQTLPELRSQITGLLFRKDKELKSMQLFREDSNTESQIVLNVIAKFSSTLADYLDGRFVKDTSKEMMGGSRLCYIFYQVYTKTLNQVDPFDRLSDEDLKTAIRNASSLRPNLFVPELAFEVLSKQQIQRLELPSLQCVQLAYEELKRIITDIDMPEFNRFHNLRKKVLDIMYQLLTKALFPCNQMVKNLVHIEESYINTYHPDFMGGPQAIMQMIDPANYGNGNQSRFGAQVLKDKQLSFEEITDPMPAGTPNPKVVQAPKLVEDLLTKPLQDNPNPYAQQNKGGLFSSIFSGSGKKKQRQEEEDAEMARKLQEEEVEGYRNDFQEYEINKYIQDGVQPIQLGQVPQSLRNAAKEESAMYNAGNGGLSPKSNMEISIIKNLIMSYFNVVRKNLNDIVPKTIIALLVNRTKNQAQRELVAQLYNDKVDLKMLLIEDEGTVKKRQQCEEVVKNLKQCLEFLNEARDFYFEDDSMKLY